MPVETHEDIQPAAGMTAHDAVETHADIKPAEGLESAQEFNSAKTSRNQVPALFNHPGLRGKSGSRNIDVGGGRFDKGTQHLFDNYGIQSKVLDPYNRSEEHNNAVDEEYLANPADTATVANVLNVIKEPEHRQLVIKNAHKYLKPDGEAYFSVYEGNGSGEGTTTRDGWQENRKLVSYLPEIKAIFPSAKVSNGAIVARKEIAKAYGGAISPVELRDGNLEDEARRLILWSYAVAPIMKPLARKDGGKVEHVLPDIDYPLRVSRKLEKALEPGEKTGRVAVMSPQQYLHHANRLPNTKEDNLLIDAFKERMQKGEKFKALKLLGNNRADGRHRATAAEELGIKKVPVLDYRKSGLKSMKGIHSVGKNAKKAGKVDDELRKERASGGPVVDDAQNAVNIARNLTPQGFYSAAAEAASKIPQKAPIDQIINKVKGSPGVKAEELDQSGVRDAFAGQKSVDPKEVARHFQENLPKIQEKIYGGAPIVHKPREIDPEDVYGVDIPSWLSTYHEVGPKDKSYSIRGANAGFKGPTEYYLHGPAGDDLGDYQSLEEATQAANDAIMGRDPAKFKEYTLPGGENYREVVMSLPPKGAGSNRGFESSHWSEPNVLAHLRMSDRKGPNGEKILHVEEVQSDWAQKGRDEGFREPEKLAALESRVQSLRDERDALKGEMRTLVNTSRADENYNAAIERARYIQSRLAQIDQTFANETNPAIDKARGAAPHGPYVTDTNSWTDLALKRALREATEGGYDKIVFTPGQTQADRYSLVHNAKKLAFHPGEKRLFVTPIGSDTPVEVPGTHRGDTLHRTIGKEAAKKLLAADQQDGMHVLEGDELATSGEGMKKFYDKLVPNRLQGLAKKLDPKAKVNLFAHPLTQEGKNEPAMAHELEVTPAMRAAVRKGFAAYKQGGSIIDHAFEVVSRLPR